MSKLSPYVRAAIDSGTALPAIVEEIHLGLATVRIGSGKGARLTNLSVMGENIVAGDQVIVDYAAGVDPIVRPMTTVSELTEAITQLELSTSVGLEELTLLTPAEGIGCCVNLFEFNRSWENGVPKLPMYQDQPLVYPYNMALWDSSGMYYPWHQGITIKDTGYYLVTFSVCEPLNATDVWAIFPPAYVQQLPVVEHKGVFRVRLLCNGVKIAEVYNRVFEDDEKNITPITATIFDHFDANDVISVETTLLGFVIYKYSAWDVWDVCYGPTVVMGGAYNNYSHRLTVQCVILG